MPVHFAAARSAARSPVARILARQAPGFAANDNDDQAGQPFPMESLRDALMHFAAHGMGAAREAHRLALVAHLAEQFEERERWAGICRTRDAREANKFERALILQDAPLIG